MMAIDDESMTEGDRHIHEHKGVSVDIEKRPSLLLVDTEWKTNRGRSLNDQRLVDILHIDIGIVVNARTMNRLTADKHRFSTSIIPMNAECRFKCT